MAVGVLVEDHKKLVRDAKCLRETLGRTQCTLAAVQTRLQELKHDQTRVEAQLDILVWMK